MGRQNDQHEFNLKEALQQWLDKSRLKQKFNETRLIESWENLMGKTVASRTEKIYIKDHVLYIRVNSAPLKKELHMSRTRILERFKEEVGENIVLDIKVL